MIFIGAPIWIIIQLLLITFNLGVYWGIGTAVFSVLLFGTYIQSKMILDLRLITENPHLLKSLIPEITVGFAVIIYLLNVFFKTSRNAENQLSLTNKALSLKNVQIEKQHAEKEILLQEVHHWVKNNMQIISSLIRLQDQEINDPVVSHVFNQAQQRILAIALIHERMYKTSEFAALNIHDYIKSLGSDIICQYSNKQEVELHVMCENIVIEHTSIVPLGLILHELIANSLLHGIENTGSIYIKMQTSENVIQFSYVDTGKGFSPSFKPGFGTNLIQILAEQLNGELIVESDENKGVHYLITFKIN